MIDTLTYTMNDARYAKDKVAIHIPGVDGWKGIATTILERTVPTYRYSNRERAYIVSKRQAERFVQAVNDFKRRSDV